MDSDKDRKTQFISKKEKNLLIKLGRRTTSGRGSLNPDLTSVTEATVEVVLVHPVVEIPYPDRPLLVLRSGQHALMEADRFRWRRRRRRGGLVVGHEGVPIGWRRHHRVLHHHRRRRVPHSGPGLGRRGAPRIYASHRLHLRRHRRRRRYDEVGERGTRSHTEKDAEGEGRVAAAKGLNREATSKRCLMLAVRSRCR
ncbi:hypothetical protein B296_00044498 [Ensete ventricosum]|uniref:Uncharacterized protein n=1 Tax=Ensete ventricosum TaxID=4639 RepID=A0A426YVZ3_ENSVE|nr:hypothetical protein B296_00044498 [Ensete ventricosum]